MGAIYYGVGNQERSLQCLEKARDIIKGITNTKRT